MLCMLTSSCSTLRDERRTAIGDSTACFSARMLQLRPLKAVCKRIPTCWTELHRSRFAATSCWAADICWMMSAVASPASPARPPDMTLASGCNVPQIRKIGRVPWLRRIATSSAAATLKPLAFSNLHGPLLKAAPLVAKSLPFMLQRMAETASFHTAAPVELMLKPSQQPCGHARLDFPKPFPPRQELIPTCDHESHLNSRALRCPAHVSITLQTLLFDEAAPASRT
jgi:hypothetical protein